MAKPVPAPLPVTKPPLPELVKNWIPPNLLRNHDGVKPWNSRRYPWGPPPEIGEILSVDSNVLESGRPSFIIRYFGVISIAVATYFVLMSGILIPVKGDLGILRVIAAGLGLVLGGRWLLWIWPARPRCTYLGVDGAAYLTGKWGSDKLVGAQVLVFSEATAFFFSKMQYSPNVFSHRTYFRFSWHRNLGETPLLTISGMHTRKNELPDSDHIYHFGLRVEEAWTRRLIKILNEHYAAGRALLFPCRKNFWKKLMPNFIRFEDWQEIRMTMTELLFVNGDQTLLIPCRDIDGVQFDGSVLTLFLYGPQWARRHGRFRMRYHDIGNAQAFWHFLSLAVANKQ